MGRRLTISEKNALALLEGGASIPFIARYRKEATGGMDEVALFELQERNRKEVTLEKRKDSILKILGSKNLLEPNLEKQINDADTLEYLEEIYSPFKTGVKTRAQEARELGFGPLAEKVKVLPGILGKLEPEASTRVHDIIAEEISKNLTIRKKLIEVAYQKGKLLSKLSKKGIEQPIEAANFVDYFDSIQEIRKIPGHRFLAISRGKNLGFLKLKLEIDVSEWEPILFRALPLQWHREPEAAKRWMSLVGDSWKRLLYPAVGKEILRTLKNEADLQAIEVFAINLRAMLSTPGRTTGPLLAIDPGFRTGCKVVVLSGHGALLDRAVIYPLEPQKDRKEAEIILSKFISIYNLQGIACGNGTGGRETEEFLRSWSKIPVWMVDERGASVYSASEIARTEFPDLDLTFRSAVSIGRRLQSPLYELVKVEPQSLGVGQYQHDIEEKLLNRKLKEEVVVLVNRKGVDVNRGGQEVLEYVSGLDAKKVNKLLSHREQIERFRTREDLRAIPGFTDEVFQQCAGFLRIEDSPYPLDRTSIHPELYPIVENLASHLSVSISEILGPSNFAKLNTDLLNTWKTRVLFASGSYGEPTWEFLVNEFQSYGQTDVPNLVNFDPSIRSLKDLHSGMVLTGRVTNVTTFGAFVDVGVHVDGLVHISQLSGIFVKNPSEVVSVGQVVQVKVLAVDYARRRLSLSGVPNLI